MNSNSLFSFGVNRRFKSLPDGRRVFFADFPWSADYVIPDPPTEQQLYRKARWANILLFASIFVIFGGLWFFKDLLRGGYYAALFWLIFIPLGGGIRWALYGNDLRLLKKIDYQSAVSIFYNDLSENLRSQSDNSFPDYEISTLLDIPNSNDKIIMLKYRESFPNILRTQLGGSIMWQAELPSTNDVYTNVEWKDRKLHAFSRSCQSVVLDENTGRILFAESNAEENSA